MESDPKLDPELDLVLVREVNAPREILYTCWTTPEHLVHWLVPKPHKVTAWVRELTFSARTTRSSAHQATAAIGF